MKFDFGSGSGFARGTTVIRDAAELRVKESDRIAVMATQLNQLGLESQNTLMVWKSPAAHP